MRVQRGEWKKVPELTVYFWVIKVLTTAMGEATSDFFIHRVGVTNIIAIGAFGVVTGLALALALALQFAAVRYVAWTYWLVVVMVGVFGTIAADGVHVGLGIPYVVSSTFFALVLAGLFVAWYASEKTLSIHSIYTPRREVFYWAVVMAAFTLGTAVGDLTAITLHLGYLESGVLFAALIALPAIAYWRSWVNEVLAFWCAYILTRPLGASFADWMAVSKGRGGLGLGYGIVSLGLTILIVGFVAYLSVSRKDVPDRSVA
jgi:uncharacterized membrane-anchored protein